MFIFTSYSFVLLLHLRMTAGAVEKKEKKIGNSSYQQVSLKDE